MLASKGSPEKGPQPGGFTQKFILSQSGGQKLLRQGVSEMFSLRRLQGRILPPSPSFWGLLVFLGLWLIWVLSPGWAWTQRVAGQLGAGTSMARQGNRGVGVRGRIDSCIMGSWHRGAVRAET